MIQRIDYLGRLARWREKPPVKAVCGVRRCGKTTLLAQYIDWLKRKGAVDDQIIYVGLEEPENEALLHYQGLYGYIKKRLCRDRFTYIFIDNIQQCADYEKAVEGLMVGRQVDLYVTVSNSRAFSRIPYVEIRMLPLSFAEYLVFTKARAGNPYAPEKTNLLKTGPAKTDRRLPRQKERMEKFLQREAFNEYLSFGGFPFTVVLGGDAALIRHYVEGIYNTVLVRDVARQDGINNIPLLETIARMMSRSAGRPLNSKKLSAAIVSKGKKTSPNTVETYMQALAAACVFYHIGRFDIKTGKHLKTQGRYYIADSGVGNLLLDKPPEIEGQLENIVCMELLRRGLQVHVGKYGNDEINFVVFGQTVVRNALTSGEPAGNEGGKTAYFQVAATVRDPAVLDRKLAPLRRINDNHPKYILSLDETPSRSNYSGIIQKNLIEWLLEAVK